MKILYTILIKLAYITIGLIFLKSSMNKINKSFLYYIALEDYEIIKNKRMLKIIAAFLISLELLLAIVLIVTVYPDLSLAIGIFIQTLYIIFLIININKKFNNNCGCFGLNTPKEITIKNLAINILILVAIVMTYGIEIRLI
ncbi:MULTISPECIES: MauE/DoxX family redox-associated membrane protein [Bacillus cereus group]|uniref:MauE/DoxX family redox-associated membrane protein n=1 Tax=Bacillus cereus group TaxID=86661 RepID=UPI000BF4363E|nr:MULTISPECIES: MauE/DoxX family redox-associated membrane protein [Bacillus cereus group]AUB63521.1 hypothetical protein CSW12_10880 [Bacillus cereus]MCU4712598.1 hypothetical protein [Bacillus cereus]PFK60503.1 hypothetical protein COJ09_13510 [Bacillus thuringiensis]